MPVTMFATALVLAAMPPAPRPLTADEQAALRCSAAFALVSAAQARGDPAAAQYPPLKLRGREFFVVTAARLMDDAGLDEAGIKAAAEAEAAGLRVQGTAPLMPFCLALLDASRVSSGPQGYAPEKAAPGG